jgi:transcriptional regulator with XRE-family HTH domain
MKKVIDMPTRTAFGRLLRAWRSREGLTLRELAERVPFSYSHLSRMESGDRNPPARRGVIQLAKALGGDLNELLLSAGYAPEGERGANPPMMAVGKEFFPDAVYEPTPDELRVINEANAEQIFFGPLTEPGFWNDPADERRAAFRYLEGLIDESRRFRRRQKGAGGPDASR